MEEAKTKEPVKLLNTVPQNAISGSTLSHFNKEQVETQTNIRKKIGILDEEIELLSILPKKTFELIRLMPLSGNDEFSQLGREVIVIISQTLTDFVDSFGNVAAVSAFCKNFKYTLAGQETILKDLPAVDDDIANFINNILKKTFNAISAELGDLPKKFHQTKTVTKEALKNLTEKIGLLLNDGGVTGSFEKIQDLMKELEILHENHRQIFFKKNADLCLAYQKKGALNATEKNNEFWEPIALDISDSLKTALKENESKLNHVKNLWEAQNVDFSQETLLKEVQTNQKALISEIAKKKSDLDKKYEVIEQNLKNKLLKKMEEFQKVDVSKVEEKTSHLWFWSFSFSTVSEAKKKENLEKEIWELNDELATNAENWETARKNLEETYKLQLELMNRQQESLNEEIQKNPEKSNKPLEQYYCYLQQENNELVQRLEQNKNFIAQLIQNKELLENEKNLMEKQIEQFEESYSEQIDQSNKMKRTTFDDLNKTKSLLENQLDSKKMGSFKQVINFSIAANGFLFAMSKHSNNLAEIDSLISSMDAFLKIQVQQLVNVAQLPITGLNYDEFTAERISEYCRKHYFAYPKLSENVLKFGLFGTVIIGLLQTESRDDLNSQFWTDLGITDHLARFSFYTYFNGLMQGQSGKMKKQFSLTGMEVIKRIMSFKNEKKLEEVIKNCEEETKKVTETKQKGDEHKK